MNTNHSKNKKDTQKYTTHITVKEKKIATVHTNNKITCSR